MGLCEARCQPLRYSFEDLQQGNSGSLTVSNRDRRNRFIVAGYSGEAWLLDSACVVLDELAQNGFRSCFVVLSVAEQDIESTMPGSRLKSANHFGKVRIRDFRDHQSKKIALARGQTPGMNVLELL
jgi:hypothetical protein